MASCGPASASVWRLTTDLMWEQAITMRNQARNSPSVTLRLSDLKQTVPDLTVFPILLAVPAPRASSHATTHLSLVLQSKQLTACFLENAEVIIVIVVVIMIIFVLFLFILLYFITFYRS